jgi:hypothetical protein
MTRMTGLTDERAVRVARLRRWTWLLDGLFRVPGTRLRVGLDALIGLIPGAGDLIGSVLSLMLVREAVALGVSRPVLARMVWNVLLDALIGVIPVVGDVLDVAWRANVRNMALIETYLADPKPATAASGWFLAGMALLVLTLFAGAVTALVVLWQWLSSVLT